MRFYDLISDYDNYEPAEEVSDRKEIVGWCPIYGRQHPAILKIKEGEDAILTIDLPSPNIGDFLTTWGGLQIITDKVAQLFKEQGFSGYELKPVRINKIKRMRKPKPIPKLWEFVVTGFAGMAPIESGVKLTYKCEACNHIEYSSCTNVSALIDMYQWDGSDFFSVYPMGSFLVTERVKNLIEEKKLTNCKVIPLEEAGIPERLMRGGKLYYYMSIDRARAFGEPLGIYIDPKKLWQRAVQLEEEQIWPNGLGRWDTQWGKEWRENEWDKEWRIFLMEYMRQGKGILSKDILIEQLEEMLKKYSVVQQAIEDITKKIEEVKNL